MNEYTENLDLGLYPPPLLLCGDCGWSGTREECKRYAPISPNDVELVDCCPKCNSENVD